MRSRGRIGALAASALIAASLLAVPSFANADPEPAGPAADQKRPVEVVSDIGAGQERRITVHSAAMDRDIPLTVLRPKDTSTPAPTLYLLNGAGGGEDEATWQVKTNYTKFFADKHVNVVTPIGGAFSYYTDWERDDPELGRNKWQTFLTEELPPLIDAHLKTTGKNAIAGISMAGTSVLNLGIAAPKLYRAVAAYSGCARTSDPLGQAYIRTVVEDRGKGDVTNMWGPMNGPGWRENDPYLNAGKLRGTKVYLTTGTGLPGEFDTLGARLIQGDPLVLLDQVLLGGAIEASVYSCTQQMREALGREKVDTKLITRPAAPTPGSTGRRTSTTPGRTSSAISNADRHGVGVTVTVSWAITVPVCVTSPSLMTKRPAGPEQLIPLGDIPPQE